MKMNYQVSSVRIHLASGVTLHHVDFGLVHEADNLNVVWGLRKLDTGNGTVRDDTSTVPGLRAPGNHFALDLPDGSACLRGSPEAEV